MLQAALAWAARGFPVFPLWPRSKEPFGLLAPNGFLSATTDPIVIRRWWSRCPTANIGVATGGWFFVVDLDSEAADRWYINSCGRHGVPQNTLEQATSRGRHLFYRTDIAVPCSTGRLAPGADIKASGGYVVVAPSIHPSGTIYRIAHKAPVAQAPQWLVDLALPPARAPSMPAPRMDYSNSNNPVIDIRMVAARGGGEVRNGGRSALIPGPGHSAKDRSLYVGEAPNHPSGFSFYSFAGDEFERCSDYIRQLAGLPKWQPGRGRLK